jgi:hypothetical protein
VGNCEHATENGGKGCDMCDRVAKLPQPKFGKKGALTDDDPFERAAEAEEDAEARQPARKAAPVAARKAAPAAAPATKKRRPDKGPQTGSLLDYEPD